MKGAAFSGGNAERFTLLLPWYSTVGPTEGGVACPAGSSTKRLFTTTKTRRSLTSAFLLN